ncbi:MAG: sensor histidine kinase, partial [Isosphaeraceae bacterium]
RLAAAGEQVRWDAAPCWVVLERDAVQLFVHPDRYFAFSTPLDPPVVESLLAPFHHDGKPVGTVWAIAHTEGRKFDGEDARRLESLSRFAAAAYQLTRVLDASESDRARLEREFAERRRASEDLRHQRDLARELIDAAPAVVLMLDPEGRITLFNRFAEQLSGFPAEEVVGQDFFTWLLPEYDRQRIREVHRKTLREVNTSGTVNPIQTRDGRERLIQWSNRVLRDAEGHIAGVLAVGQDITELKDAHDRALRAERLAAIGEFITGLAHESRNALQRGQACLEMLALEVSDRPRALDLIVRLQKAQHELARVYDEVRHYATAIRLERHPIEVAEVWRAAWADLEPERSGRAALLLEQLEAGHTRCRVDAFRMKQVFRNLLDNALAACPDPVDIAIRCDGDALDGQPALRISVKDNGPGVAPAQAPRLFEAFYTTRTRGTGLGLAICRRIVEAHGGRIDLGDSGRGAEFVIVLPRGDG